MRKLAASTALTVAIGLFLTGCGNAEDATVTPGQGAAATETPSAQTPSETAAEQEDEMLSLEDTCAEFNRLVRYSLYEEFQDGRSLVVPIADELLELSKRSPVEVKDQLAAVATASEEELNGSSLDDKWNLVYRTCHTEAYEKDPSTPWNPVPAEKVAYFELEDVDLEDTDGYTGSLSGDIEVPEFKANPKNAKPGFVDLERATPTDTLSFFNTTAEREAPTLMMIQVSLYYPAGSLACETYMNRSDKRGEFGEVLYGPEYCVVPSNFLAAGDTGMAVGTIGPGKYMSYTNANEYIAADIFNAHRLVGVPEGEAEPLLAALNDPLGVVVTKWGPDDYSPQVLSCEFPTNLTTSSGSPTTTTDEPTPVLMAAGPFCE